MAYYDFVHLPGRGNVPLPQPDANVGIYRNGGQAMNQPDDVMLVQFLLDQFYRVLGGDTHPPLGGRLEADGAFGPLTHYRMLYLHYRVSAVVYLPDPEVVMTWMRPGQTTLYGHLVTVVCGLL